MKLSIVAGIADTRLNKEDFALTPYLSSVIMNGSNLSVYGLSLTWGFYSVYLGVGKNVPKQYRFMKLTKNYNHEHRTNT